MQKAKIVGQVDSKILKANFQIEEVRKEERFKRLNKEKENPFYILKKAK